MLGQFCYGGFVDLHYATCRLKCLCLLEMAVRLPLEWIPFGQKIALVKKSSNLEHPTFRAGIQYVVFYASMATT